MLHRLYSRVKFRYDSNNISAQWIFVVLCKADSHCRLSTKKAEVADKTMDYCWHYYMYFLCGSWPFLFNLSTEPKSQTHGLLFSSSYTHLNSYGHMHNQAFFFNCRSLLPTSAFLTVPPLYVAPKAVGAHSLRRVNNSPWGGCESAIRRGNMCLLRRRENTSRK